MAALLSPMRERGLWVVVVAVVAVVVVVN